MKQSEAWALGMELVGDRWKGRVASIHLDPTQIGVLLYDLNEDGKKFSVVDPTTHERVASQHMEYFPYEVRDGAEVFPNA